MFGILSFVLSIYPTFNGGKVELIIGERYGSIYKDDGSYTETEYNYALAKGKPVLIFVKKDFNVAISNEELERQIKLRNFINRVKGSEKNTMFWENKDQLATCVSVSLTAEIQNNPQVGWVRANSNKIETINYSASSCNYIEKISQATNSIFFSGTGMPFLGDHALRMLVSKIKPTITVDFFAADLTNNRVLNAVIDMYGKYEKEWLAYRTAFEGYINEIEATRKVDVTFLDFFVPTTYFAVDYKQETPYSFIQARHYILRHDSDTIPQVLHYFAQPKTALYDRFREQILLITASKEKGGKLARHQ